MRNMSFWGMREEKCFGSQWTMTRWTCEKEGMSDCDLSKIDIKCNLDYAWSTSINISSLPHYLLLVFLNADFHMSAEKLTANKL